MLAQRKGKTHEESQNYPLIRERFRDGNREKQNRSEMFHSPFTLCRENHCPTTKWKFHAGHFRISIPAVVRRRSFIAESLPQ